MSTVVACMTYFQNYRIHNELGTVMQVPNITIASIMDIALKVHNTKYALVKCTMLYISPDYFKASQLQIKYLGSSHYITLPAINWFS